MKTKHLLFFALALSACGTVKKTATSKKTTSSKVIAADSAKQFSNVTFNFGSTDIQTDTKETAKRQTTTERFYIYDTIRNTTYLQSEKTTLNEETEEQMLKRERRVDSLIDAILESSTHNYLDSSATVKKEEATAKEAKRFSSSFWFWLIGVALVGVAVWVAYKLFFKRYTNA